MTNRIEFKSAGLMPPQAKRRFGVAFPDKTAAEVAEIHAGLKANGLPKLAAGLRTYYADKAPSPEHLAEFNSLIAE